MSPALWWLHHAVIHAVDQTSLPTHSAELPGELETSSLPWARLEEFSSTFRGPAHWPQYEKKLVLLSKELQWGKTALDRRVTYDRPGMDLYAGTATQPWRSFDLVAGQK